MAEGAKEQGPAGCIDCPVFLPLRPAGPVSEQPLPLVSWRRPSFTQPKPAERSRHAVYPLWGAGHGRAFLFSAHRCPAGLAEPGGPLRYGLRQGPEFLVLRQGGVWHRRLDERPGTSSLLRCHPGGTGRGGDRGHLRH